MKWVYPEFLFALAVILIPLLIHLFHFKRYRTVFFSSLTFLKSVEQNQKNTRKLKYWVIFAMRALAFAFLVFAFAQPYFPGAGKDDRSAKNVIGVYVDNSFSMTRIGENGELVSQARELAKSVVGNSPRTTRFVLITNELSGSEKQTLTQAQFMEKVEKIKPSPLVRSASDVLNWWKQFLSDEQNQSLNNASTRLVYLSDFQKSTFGKTVSLSGVKSVVYPVVLAPVNAGNIYVDSIWFETPVQKQGAKQTIYVILKNDGGEAVNTVDVNIRIGPVNRDVFANLPSNGTDTVELSYYNNEAGRIRGSVVVNDKQMNMDDSYYFSYDVRKNSEVLIIDGEDAVSNIGLVYSLDDFYKVAHAAQNSVYEADFRNKDLAVINGANQVSASLADELTDFAANGGTILLFPGNNAGTGGWNGFLSKINMPQIGQLQTSSLTIRKLNARDPFYNGVFERTPENINLPVMKEAYRLQSGSSTQSIDLLTFRNGNSFFVKGTGKYNVYLSAGSLSPKAGSFTGNQLFSTLLLRIGELSQRQSPYYLIIGEDGSYPVKEPGNAEQPLHLKKNNVDFVPSAFRKKGSMFLSVQGLEAVRQLESGNYTIESGDEKLGNLSINYNRKESRVAPMTQTEIADAFAAAGLTVKKISNAEAWTGAAFLQLNQAESFWKTCALIALLFLLAEMAVIYFWKQ